MLDDFICKITCEEYYNEEELWGRIKIESLNHGHDRGCSTNAGRQALKVAKTIGILLFGTLNEIH